MGTRGLWGFKWRGRYYVYYNHFDSYPEGLGRSLVRMIPSDPAKYREWLKQKRAIYSKAEAMLQSQVLSVTPTRVRNGNIVPLQACGLQDLERLPTYDGMSECDLFIEWTYMIDLDQELFQVSKQAYFGLSAMPSTDWISLLHEAAQAHLDACAQARGSWETAITSTELASNPAIKSGIRHPDEIGGTWPANYTTINPTIVRPKQRRDVSNRPIVQIARQVFSDIVSNNQAALWNAAYTSTTSNRLFQEAAYILLCVCSASRHLLRMCRRIEQTEATIDASFGVFSPTPGIRDTPEFASALFQGYFKEGISIDAPHYRTAYWLLDVLVYLERNLSHELSIKSAVAEAVHFGRQEGRVCFDIIITSIAHVILVHVTASGVQHTRRLNLIHEASVAASLDYGNPFRPYEDNPEDEEEQDEGDDNNAADEDGENDKDRAKEGDKNKGEQQTEAEVLTTSDPKVSAADTQRSKWVETEDVDVLGAIAGVFEATTLDSNVACAFASQGSFPNEVYRIIFEFIDSKTRISCSTVSRAFRRFASESFDLDDNLKIFAETEAEKIVCSHEDYGLLGLVDIGKTRKSQKGVRWYPVIGLANDTASFSLDRPWIDGLAVHNLEIEDKSGTYETPQEGRRFTVDSEVARRKYMAAARNSEPIDEPNWTIFETSLPHQQVIATARDVLDIYGLVFFDGPGIMGCNRNKVFPYHGSRNWQEISLVPENVFYHVGARSITEENAGSYLQYAVAWSVQPEEDSDGGWIEAIRGATTFATEVILVDAYRAWLANSVEGPDDFAIVIVIGGRCRFFHQGNLVELLQTIKPLSKCPGLEPGDVYLPRVVEDGSELDYWTQAGISIDAVRESIHQGWEPIFEVSHGGNIVPANVHDLDHRSSISEGFTWMANIAATRGTRDDRYW